jgi:uncharacterized protein involved in type VI secretion and phage assembly
MNTPEPLRGSSPRADRNLRLEVEGGPDFDVRSFSVRERLSTCFVVDLEAVCADSALDLEALVGRAARFAIHGGTARGYRAWHGLCQRAQIRGSAAGGTR